MQFSILTILSGVALAAILIDWQIAVRKGRLENYPWNQAVFPYPPAFETPPEANSRSGPIRIPMPFGMTGSTKYANSHELFVSNHRNGWNLACNHFVKHRVTPKNLEPLPKLHLTKLERWSTTINKWEDLSHESFTLGYLDAKERLEILEKTYPEEQLRQKVKAPTPWYYPVGRTILCLLYTSPSPRDRQKSRMPSSA